MYEKKITLESYDSKEIFLLKIITGEVKILWGSFPLKIKNILCEFLCLQYETDQKISTQTPKIPQLAQISTKLICGTCGFLDMGRMLCQFHVLRLVSGNDSLSMVWTYVQVSDNFRS